MGFQTWEFIALANMALVFVVPWIYRRPCWIIGMAVFPFAASFLEWLFAERLDLGFHFLVILLHWNLSLTNLLLLCYAVDKNRFYYVIAVSSSAIISIVLFFLTPSLTILDPFWGVLPGVVLADPIIPLEPYLIRLGVSFVGWTILFAIGRLKHIRALYVGAYWLLLFLVGYFLPTPFLSTSFLRSNFETTAKTENIRLFLQDSDDFSLSAETMAHELQFLFDQLKARLPASSKLSPKAPLEIYLYRSHAQKAYWVGARETQIGNFYKSQMHLSYFDLTSDFLPHELAHLIHGKLKAPLRTYLNPTQFEGFAVALSAPNLQLPLREGAAIYQQMKQPPTRWPHYLEFAKYARPVSYRLSGAFAALQLKANRYPWSALKTPEISSLKNYEISEEEKKQAQDLLRLKPLHRNPAARDCARHRHDFATNRSLHQWQRIDRYCRSSRISLREAYRLPDTRSKKMALQLIGSKEAEGDLSILENDFEQASTAYAQCATEHCDLKRRLLPSPSSRATLQEILLSKDPVGALYRHHWRLPGIQEKRIQSVRSLHKKVVLYQDLKLLRDLTDAERLDFAKARFFAALSLSPGIAKTAARRILNSWKNSPPANSEAFLERLRREN